MTIQQQQYIGGLEIEAKRLWNYKYRKDPRFCEKHYENVMQKIDQFYDSIESTHVTPIIITPHPKKQC